MTVFVFLGTHFCWLKVGSERLGKGTLENRGAGILACFGRFWPVFWVFKNRPKPAKLCPWRVGGGSKEESGVESWRWVGESFCRGRVLPSRRAGRAVEDEWIG